MHRRILGLSVLVLSSCWAAGSASAQTPDSAAAAPVDSSLVEDPTPLRGLTLAALRADPARFEGRLVVWEGQFLSVERADSLRTDLRPGETYILAREANGEPGYLYGVVPPGLRAEVRRLVPLERIEILARVRTGRAPLMGYPVLDLERIAPLRTEASRPSVRRRPQHPLENP